MTSTKQMRGCEELETQRRGLQRGLHTTADETGGKDESKKSTKGYCIGSRRIVVEKKGRAN